MIITSTLVRSYASMYTEEQLRSMIRAAAEKLASEPDMLTSVNAGGGVTYSRQERVKLTDLLELYQQALEYKTSGGELPQTDIAQFGRPVFPRTL